MGESEATQIHTRALWALLLTQQIVLHIKQVTTRKALQTQGAEVGVGEHQTDFCFSGLSAFRTAQR